VPSLPFSDAVELGRKVVAAGDGATSAGAAVSTAGVQYTASRGAPIPVTGVTQRAAIGWASQSNPALVYRLDTGAIEINRGTGWYPVAPGAWLTYTPHLTAGTTNPNLGFGHVQAGEYTVVDHMCTVLFDVTFGASGTSAGAGTYTMALPVPAATTGSSRLYGAVHYEDAGTGGGTLFVRGSSTSTSVVTFLIGSSGGALVTATAPMAWAAGDNIRGTFTYPIA